MKVLIAEDDKHLLMGLKEILEREGFSTLSAEDGKKALDIYAEEKPDFICLDVMMPEIDGYSVCREIRKTNPDIPIIFISAKTEEIDKVVGLELGADDYISKPFGVKEVTARIRAIARRCIKQSAEKSDESFIMHHLTIHPDELKALTKEGLSIELSLREIKLLRLFHRNKGKLLERNEIFNALWGVDYMPNSRTLDQQISRLRKKIEADHLNPLIIKTIHGAGYRYE